MDTTRLLWTLPASRSKNKREHVTPLVGMAREIVENAMKGIKSGPLFRTALSRRALTSSDVGDRSKSSHPALRAFQLARSPQNSCLLHGIR